MSLWREVILRVFLLCTVAFSAAASCMIFHGLLIQRRLRRGQPISKCVTWKEWVVVELAGISECVTWKAWAMAAGAGGGTLLLLTQAGGVPWDWLGSLVLLVATAPAVLTFLGPPDQHLECNKLCQIGRGSAYGHYFGYLRLMRGPYRIKTRLEKFRHNNPAGISDQDLRDFYSTAVVALAPTDGTYPSTFTDLEGVGKELCKLKEFECSVGGTKRSYGGFGVYEVTSSDGQRRLVALDRIGALGTLCKLRQHGPAGLNASDCGNQMNDLLEQLEKFVEEDRDLKGQLKVVKYSPDEHVGDAIITAIDGR